AAVPAVARCIHKAAHPYQLEAPLNVRDLADANVAAIAGVGDGLSSEFASMHPLRLVDGGDGAAADRFPVAGGIAIADQGIDHSADNLLRLSVHFLLGNRGCGDAAGKKYCGNNWRKSIHSNSPFSVWVNQYAR